MQKMKVVVCNCVTAFLSNYPWPQKGW